MNTAPSSRKSQAPRSGFEENNPRPLKRHRRWCDTVERFALANGIETDSHRLSQRQKQVDYGKNTLAYDRFIAACPREQRKKGDPMTPLIRQKCSKRSFMGQVTSWKKKVYAYVAELDKAAGEGNPPEIDEEFKLDGGAGARKISEGTTCNAPAEHGSYAASTERSTEAVTDDGEVDLSDLDDIELDDQGNVVSANGAAPTCATTSHHLGSKKDEVASPSIFTPYEL
ncbi:Oocyte-specific histone RNA stem-loop-binding protein [Gracilaria domingensis]|nr:Oocyte-specific histone RNA stem-loop-binding protein [Gracilaria domingensis]